MKTFRHEKGNIAGTTMTVGELRKYLEQFPDDLPVMATWESVAAYICPGNFEIDHLSKGHPDDACDCLFIDVNMY